MVKACGLSLWRSRLEADDKTFLTAQNEPEVVFLTLYLHHSFVGVPLVRGKIERGNELYSYVFEHQGEVSKPVPKDGVVGLFA